MTAKEIFTSHVIRPRCKTFPEKQDVRYGKHRRVTTLLFFLTDRKTRHLTGASREISPMQRVDIDGNSHLQGDDVHVRVPTKHKGRTTRHADHETTEGFRADPPPGNVDSYNIVYSWCIQIPKAEATSGAAILASRLFIYGTKVAKAGVMKPVLQIFSTGKEEHGAKGNAVRAHRWLLRRRDFTHAQLRLFTTLSDLFKHLLRIRLVGYTRISRPSTAFVTLQILITHDARCDPTRKATASRVYQEKSNLRFLPWTARQTLPDLLYRITKILSTFEKCLPSEAHVCETTLWNMRYSSLRAISILISDSSRDKVVTARFCDDSRCHENRNNSKESTRTQETQQVDITALKLGDALNAVRMLVRSLSWSLTGSRRIRRSSLMIGAHKLSNVVEQELQGLLPLT